MFDGVCHQVLLVLAMSQYQDMPPPMNISSPRATISLPARDIFMLSRTVTIAISKMCRGRPILPYIASSSRDNSFNRNIYILFLRE
jgi:hypothetical protein